MITAIYLVVAGEAALLIGHEVYLTDEVAAQWVESLQSHRLDGFAVARAEVVGEDYG